MQQTVTWKVLSRGNLALHQIEFGLQRLATQFRQKCGTKKWPGETPGMCCTSGKVKLPPLSDPPPPLMDLMSVDTPESKHFLTQIRKYNSAFQMTSFGAKRFEETGFMPTFKIQGQVYHRIGSLLPTPNENPQFLQVYFMGDTSVQARHCCNSNSVIKPEIILQLSQLLKDNNHLIQSF